MITTKVDKKFSESLNQFQEALKRLSEVLDQEENEYIRDSAIKRFELVFELSWKTIKAFLETQLIICQSPKKCFQEAFRQGLIGYEQEWLNMCDSRNEATHIYNQEIAEDIYSQLPDFLKAFEQLEKNLKKEIENL
ncbi:nucleotidyltransferase substrate binding protein [Patescibacteria group bacterium]|nr:nucleotidyltransferase substrate binding protein [Patescibacteria group bacterium]MBU0897803.1 nucleotidyltransferase substrate binding protein [Patescibacteria group bacterium]MBU1782976.1 nucleotidyltransferase substrate binding protein [Patescibacteria group bacterium]